MCCEDLVEVLELCHQRYNPRNSSWTWLWTRSFHTLLLYKYSTPSPNAVEFYVRSHIPWCLPPACQQCQSYDSSYRQIRLSHPNIYRCAANGQTNRISIRCMQTCLRLSAIFYLGAERLVWVVEHRLVSVCWKFVNEPFSKWTIQFKKLSKALPVYWLFHWWQVQQFFHQNRRLWMNNYRISNWSNNHPIPYNLRNLMRYTVVHPIDRNHFACSIWHNTHTA